MSKRILVIDDSSTIQKVIRIAFAPYDVRIDAAGHFVEGLNAARQLQPDLILADANLAGVRSVRDFQRLASEARGVPLVLLYGSYDQVDEQLFREAGFTMFIRKPFDSSDIVLNVKRVLGHDFARKADAAKAAAATPLSTPVQRSEAAPAAKPQPAVMDGLLGDFAATKPKAPEPVPMPEVSTSWMTGPEPQVDIPNDMDEGVSTLVMESLLAQTLTDNSRKGERAFNGDMTISARPGAAKAPEDVASRAEYRVAPNPPPEADSLDVHDLVDRPKAPETLGFKAPTSDELTGLLRPLLREELGRMVAEAVDEYCDKHFPGVARDVITAEIRRLADEKTRHLVD